MQHVHSPKRKRVSAHTRPRPKAREVRKFFTFANERERIRLKRKEGKPAPWTEDETLATYHFTNVSRFHDRVTQYCFKHVYKEHKAASFDLMIFNLALFRMFNWPQTWEAHGGFKWAWTKRVAREMAKSLQKYSDAGNKIFTNAYIISAGGSSRPKLDYMLDAVPPLWMARYVLTEEANEQSMEVFSRTLRALPTWGWFTSYEVACDLEYTHHFNPTDKYTWANPGPGATRGINHIYGQKMGRAECIEAMQHLLLVSGNYWEHDLDLDMRCIEHTLCEYMKYVRGNSNRRYRPYNAA